MLSSGFPFAGTADQVPGAGCNFCMLERGLSDVLFGLIRQRMVSKECFVGCTGLDARAAAVVIRVVRNIVNTGRTIVCEPLGCA